TRGRVCHHTGRRLHRQQRQRQPVRPYPLRHGDHTAAPPVPVRRHVEHRTVRVHSHIAHQHRVRARPRRGGGGETHVPGNRVAGRKPQWPTTVGRGTDHQSVRRRQTTAGERLRQPGRTG